MERPYEEIERKGIMIINAAKNRKAVELCAVDLNHGSKNNASSVYLCQVIRCAGGCFCGTRQVTSIQCTEFSPTFV